MTNNIYENYLPQMEMVKEELEKRIEQIREDIRQKVGMDTIEHCLSRIKSDESMREKCRRKNLPETAESALCEIHDAIGFRIVCAFVDDVYAVRDRLASFEDCKIIKEKDYIRHAKSNGYRSYHMILRFRDQFYVEFQLRTISMDTWAALEHHLKYKKQIQNESLIIQELKRCADELASTDITMQTIRDMILS